MSLREIFVKGVLDNFYEEFRSIYDSVSPLFAIR